MQLINVVPKKMDTIDSAIGDEVEGLEFEPVRSEELHYSGSCSSMASNGDFFDNVIVVLLFNVDVNIERLILRAL